MTAIKVSNTDSTGAETGGVVYHFTTPHNEHYHVSRIPAAGGQPVLIKIGSASNFVVMSQANLSDVISRQRTSAKRPEITRRSGFPGSPSSPRRPTFTL